MSIFFLYICSIYYRFMLKTILLLTPIYVTLFWSIILNGNSRIYSIPRLFLGKFMIFAFIVYLSHFLFFFPLPDYYPFIDPLYQYASLMVYPMFYIYIRLLTIDKKFSCKAHSRYLIPSTVLLILYFLGVVFTPLGDYKSWLYDKTFFSDTLSIQYLNVVHILIRITFLCQVLAILTGNFILVKKYGDKAKQYYSDLEDSSTRNVNKLNLLMIITSCTSIIFAALGRNFFTHEITGIAVASVIFSSMLFLIGWLGNIQKTLNPSFETGSVSDFQSPEEELSFGVQKKLLEKILILFNDEKVYLDNKLNIQEVAQAVGTNRTYLSTIINQQFDLNFCNFVNNYRFEELEKVVLKHPEYTNQLLAESCGFGSVDSLKRAVSVKTKQKLSEWKKQFVSKQQKEVKIST